MDTDTAAFLLRSVLKNEAAVASCQNDLYLWWVKMLTGATEKKWEGLSYAVSPLLHGELLLFHRIFCLTSPLMRGVLLFNNVFFVREYFLITLNMNGKVSKARCKHHFLFVMRHLFAGSYWNAV